MMKPFRAHLVEQQEDFEYKLCSIENIHSDEIMTQIRLALGRYGLVDLSKNGILTQITASEKKQFDEYPFMPVYVCKVILSNPLSSVHAVQSVSLFTRIKDTKLKFFDKNDDIVMDGSDGQQHALPVEVDTKTSQAEVGDARSKTLVSDLMRELSAKRNAETIEREVYEGWVASHHEIKKMVGKMPRRGFYLVEYENNGTGTITGPFKKCPDNYDYIVEPHNVSVINETVRDNLVEYTFDHHETDIQNDPVDAPKRLEGKKMSVVVVNQDTGKEYTVVVTTDSDLAARTQAIEVMARKTGLPKERFIPTHPEVKK